MKKETKDILIIVVSIFFFIFLFLLLMFPNLLGYLFMRNCVSGQYVEGYHSGFGEECGQYPVTRILMVDCYPVPTVYKDFIWHDDGTPTPFVFGNDFKSIENLEKGVYYKICYHQESRIADADASSRIFYWVIDSIEETQKP